MSSKSKVVIDDFQRDELKKQLILYSIGTRDIRIVRKLLVLVGSDQKRENDSLNRETKEAIMNAFIITYGRIFKNNKIIGRIDSIESMLSDDEKALHKCLITLRDQFYAHNDPVATRVNVSYMKEEDKIYAEAEYNGQYWTDEFKEKIPLLLDKIEDIFKKQKESLISQLYSKMGAYSVGDGRSYYLGYNARIFENCIDDSKK